jgi:hypothetical protein
MIFAIVAIAIMAGMIFAGSYAWFVRTASVDANGGNDKVSAEAAYFNLGVRFNRIVPGHINWNNNNYEFKECENQTPPAYNFWTPDPQGLVIKKFYPGDAVRYWYTVNLKHNREVLLRVKFTGNNDIDKILADVVARYNANTDNDPEYNTSKGSVNKTQKLSAMQYVPTETYITDDIMSIEGQLTLDFGFNEIPILNNQIFPAGNGVYYIFVKADQFSTVYGSGSPTDIGRFNVTFGIKGCPFNQNYWMNQPLEVGIAPKITAVQATAQAIKDVFGPDFAQGSPAETWLKGFVGDIHDGYVGDEYVTVYFMAEHNIWDGTVWNGGVFCGTLSTGSLISNGNPLEIHSVAKGSDFVFTAEAENGYKIAEWWIWENGLGGSLLVVPPIDRDIDTYLLTDVQDDCQVIVVFESDSTPRPPRTDLCPCCRDCDHRYCQCTDCTDCGWVCVQYEVGVASNEFDLIGTAEVTVTLTNATQYIGDGYNYGGGTDGIMFLRPGADVRLDILLNNYTSKHIGKYGVPDDSVYFWTITGDNGETINGGLNNNYCEILNVQHNINITLIVECTCGFCQ